ncbi:MAG: hypothetical protein JWM20_881 [Patescibacteria group bacterium]|nr:hypothetical protein [Patescibacteria group bacterium]
MNASRPAARPAHTFAHLVESDFNAVGAGLFLLCGSNPANPFVAGQGSYVLPYVLHLGVRSDSLLEIIRQRMDSSVRKRILGHGRSLAGKGFLENL